MKIRTDFVTNSSSSSFSITLRVHTDKDSFSFARPPYDIDGGDRECFDGELSDSRQYNDVASLARFLADAVQVSPDDDPDDHAYCRELEEARSEFVKELTENIKSVDEISTISLAGFYYAIGEMMELVENQDERLYDLAQKYHDSEGAEKEIARKRLLEHIHSPVKLDNPYGDFFKRCKNFDKFEYRFDDENLDELVERLLSDRVADEEQGGSLVRYDMKTGEIYSEGFFYLE